jgi:hypothetical protein
MTYAVPSDVTTRLGRAATAEESAMITVLLADVERLILRRIPDLAAQIAAVPPTIDEADVVQVEAQAVLRVVRNPDGFVSETDGTYTYQLSHNSSPGALEVWPEEWALLGLYRSAMVVVAANPVMPCWSSSDDWCWW